MQHSPVATFAPWLASRGALARSLSPQIDFTTLGMFIIGVFVLLVFLPNSRNMIKSIFRATPNPITLYHNHTAPTKHHEPQVEIPTNTKRADQIHYGPPGARTVANDVIGGAGTYGVIGARLFSPPPLSRNIGWIVDAGRDFPSAIRKQLLALDTWLKIRETPERLTTRGWNSYGPEDHREFKYLTPKKRLEADDLISAGLLVAKTVHLICSPARAQMVCYELRGVLDDRFPSSRTRFIWEPVPDLCTPEHRVEMYKTLKLMHVISPNHTELAGFYGIEDPIDISTPDTIVSLATKLVTAGIGPSGAGAVIVRCGKMGCFVSSRKRMNVWLPAYYQPEDEGTKENGDKGDDTKDGKSSNPRARDGGKSHPKVVDPTGGGNSFIGGLAIGLVRSGGNFVLAAAMGTVAASFAIEQIGIPTLSKKDGRELWNGVEVQGRLEEYRKRVEGMGISLG